MAVDVLHPFETSLQIVFDPLSFLKERSTTGPLDLELLQGGQTFVLADRFRDRAVVLLPLYLHDCTRACWLGFADGYKVCKLCEFAALQV